MNVQEIAVINSIAKMRDYRTTLTESNFSLVEAGTKGDEAKAAELETGIKMMQEALHKQTELCKELVELAGYPWDYLPKSDKDKIRKAAGV